MLVHGNAFLGHSHTQPWWRQWWSGGDRRLSAWVPPSREHALNRDLYNPPPPSPHPTHPPASPSTPPKLPTPLSPFLTGRMFVRPNILRTLRRTMIRFLIEHLVRRIWFGQSRLYFILNWLVMRCKLRPELAADAQQTAWWKCRLKSSQVKSVYFNHPSQGNSTNYYLILGSPRQGCAFHKSTQVNK